MENPPAAEQEVNREQWWTRDHTLVLVLAAATVLLLYLCWKLVQPFFGPIAWGVALAVIAYPLHRWLLGKVKRPALAATLAVVAVAIILLAPGAFVVHSVVREATAGVKRAQDELAGGKWRERLAKYPKVQEAISTLEQQASVETQVQTIAAEVGKRASRAVAGSAWAVVELALTLFVLFFLFRDRDRAVQTLRSFVPLSSRETDEVFKRVADTIHATIYGTIAVAMVQGLLGGLMFWWLGVPGAILWGAVMGLVAIVPVLGSFVIWGPAAIFLAASGNWGKAMILTVWGAVVVSMIDNLLYPILVGKRLRMHTVPVFFSIVGGLAVFGTTGLILGPIVLALTDAVLEVWRRRTAFGRPAEMAVAPELAGPKKESVHP